MSNAAVGNKFTIKIFHVAFMQILTTMIEISVSKSFKNIQIALQRFRSSTDEVFETITWNNKT
jgi:hypothetical protein